MLHFSSEKLSVVPTELNEKQRWVTEASDLGIQVGHTPRQITTVIDGKMMTFTHIKMDEYESHIYANTEMFMNNSREHRESGFVVRVIVVFND